MRCILFHSVGGRNCIESVGLNQEGQNRMTDGRLGVCPKLSFLCNARITRIRFRLYHDPVKIDYPYIQVWRPHGSEIHEEAHLTYKKIYQFQVFGKHIVWSPDILADISLIGNDRMLVQPGDVIGYYHPSTTGFSLSTIQTDGYVLYEFRIDGSTATSINLDIAHESHDFRQPAIKFTIGKNNNATHYYTIIASPFRAYKLFVWLMHALQNLLALYISSLL